MEHHQSVGWPGFSPGPLSVSMSPAPDQPSSFEFSTSRAGAGLSDEPGSPLVFMRTPGATVQDTTCPDSSKRFNSWMESTSPYAGRKTPPTASMKSLVAGDENTPPGHDMARGLCEKQGGSFGSQQHFQSWLHATHSNSWTPRKSPAAATPPPAPAPSPAAAPMSIMRDLQHSATTPPSSHRVQAQGPAMARAAAAAPADDFDTSEEEEDDDGGEASTTVGAAQLAAAADRAAATSRIAGQRAQQQQQLSTPPRVPASSPVVPGPAVLGLQQQQQQASLLQAAADRMAQDSLATPMSQLSISKRPGAAAAQHGSSGLTPAALLDGDHFSRAAAASGPPASPAEKLIDLMLSPGAGGGHTRRRTRHHDHHQQQTQQQQQLTPSRLSAAFGPGSSTAAHAPLSPNLQVIDLMMHPDAAAGGSDATADGDGSSNADAAAVRVMQEQLARAAQEEAVSGTDEDTASDVSDRGSESDDEMDLSELQALVGEGVGPDTPLSVILGMLTGTPQLAGLTPAVGAAKQQHGGNDDIGPRVLFADD